MEKNFQEKSGNYLGKIEKMFGKIGKFYRKN